MPVIARVFSKQSVDFQTYSKDCSGKFVIPRTNWFSGNHISVGSINTH